MATSRPKKTTLKKKVVTKLTPKVRPTSSKLKPVAKKPKSTSFSDKFLGLFFTKQGNLKKEAKNFLNK